MDLLVFARVPDLLVFLKLLYSNNRLRALEGGGKILL